VKIPARNGIGRPEQAVKTRIETTAIKKNPGGFIFSLLNLLKFLAREF
jgi:hypothetical protein